MTHSTNYTESYVVLSHIAQSAKHQALCEEPPQAEVRVPTGDISETCQPGKALFTDTPT